MEWVKQPFIQNVTKKPACIVTNKYGNKTKISLESLRNEDEVEQRFKGKSYSMIWVNEGSKYKKRKTFDTLKRCFRKPHIKPEDHLLLIDTNPDLELGQESFWYQLFYGLDAMSEIPEELIPLRDSLRLIEFSVDDNLSLSEEDKAKLRADFAHDEDLMAAYYYGKWVTASTDALFYKVFRPHFHVIGEIETASNPEPEIIVPTENCFELITGLDPGGVNCSAHIVEKIIPDKVLYPQYGEKPVFNVLDELVIVGEDFDLEDFVEQMVKKMEHWENIIGKPGKILWRHWSDRSAFDMRIAFSQIFWHQAIYQYSGGKVSLMAAERGKGSVNQRIELFRKLLFEERIFINKNFCPYTIQMCKSIRKGTTAAGGIARGSPHKHCFDSLTYAISSECFDEIHKSAMRTMKGSKNESTLVSVAL